MGEMLPPFRQILDIVGADEHFVLLQATTVFDGVIMGIKKTF